MVKIINSYSQNSKLVILYVFLFLFFIIISLTGNIKAKKAENVIVFVLDLKVNYNFVENKSLDIVQNITHGSIVTRIIQKKAPEIKILFYPLENNNGVIQEKLYLSALKKIIHYKIIHPQQRILVNISLAFSDYNQLHHQLIKKLHQTGVEIIAATGK